MVSFSISYPDLKSNLPYFLDLIQRRDKGGEWVKGGPKDRVKTE
jgi:hypothetical protein